MTTKCPIHGEEISIIMVCKKCTRPMNEEFHENELKEGMTEYYNLKEKKETKSDG